MLFPPACRLSMPVLIMRTLRTWVTPTGLTRQSEPRPVEHRLLLPAMHPPVSTGSHHGSKAARAAEGHACAVACWSDSRARLTRSPQPSPPVLSTSSLPASGSSESSPALSAPLLPCPSLPGCSDQCLLLGGRVSQGRRQCPHSPGSPSGARSASACSVSWSAAVSSLWTCSAHTI